MAAGAFLIEKANKIQTANINSSSFSVALDFGNRSVLKMSRFSFGFFVDLMENSSGKRKHAEHRRQSAVGTVAASTRLKMHYN